MSNKTALYDQHLNSHAKIVDFAGYDMPISYAEGMIAEHLWVRDSCGIFDVSHMGQFLATGSRAAELFSHITPTSFQSIADSNANYTVLTTEKGTIIDDLIIAKLADDKFFVVINAGCKEKDMAWIKKHAVNFDVDIETLEERALIAVQGSKAEEILSMMIGDIAKEISYMTSREVKATKYGDLMLSRVGYTGEDGFEISVENDKASQLWQDLLENDAVKPTGLGARDSLRLEMGYPLYGHDITDQTSVIEACLGWVISNDNTAYIGAENVAKIKEQGVRQKRVGIKLLEKGIAREGMSIFNQENKKIGELTSAGYSPSLESSIGQGYVAIDFAKKDTEVFVEIRGKKKAAIICSPMFLKPRTKR
jgi:aminomethyltransferase